MDPAIIGAGLKFAGAVFGGKTKSAGENRMSDLRGMMDAARTYGPQYGFNPLTILGAAGGAIGPSQSSSPLASLSVLGDFVEEKYGEDGKERREHNRLSNELLALQVQNARTLVGVAPPSAVAGIGNGPPALNGGRTTPVSTGTGTSGGNLQLKVLGPDREIKQTPTEDLSGFMRVRNGLTDKDGFLIPGSDGEPLDIWQIPVVAGSWAADKAWDIGSAAGDWLATSDKSPLQKTRFAPDGHTDDGKPFWKTANGITFTRPVARDGGKDY